MKLKYLILATTGLFLCALSTRADIASGLIASWPLNDGPGSQNAADISGNGNVGQLTNFADTAYNNMWTNNPDPIHQDSYAMVFNNPPGTNTFGTNTYVNMANSTSLNIGKTTWTISAWVYFTIPPASEPANAGIIAKGNVGAEAYALYVSGGNFVNIFHNNANNGGETIASTNPLVANTWYNVTATVLLPRQTGSLAEDLVYVNGSLVSATNSNTYTTAYTTNSPVTIGSRASAITGFVTNSFQGIIDNVRIYNRAMTASDVMQLYQNGQYWDAAQLQQTPGGGGTGNWDSSTADWWVGGNFDTNWNLGVAYFNGSAGTVTLNANESVAGLSFQSPGYTIAEGIGNPVLTLTGAGITGGATVTVPAGSATTIDCPITGTQGMNIGGNGQLVLGAANTYTGVTTLGPGTVVNCGVAEIAGTSGPFGKSAASNPGSIVLDGGILQYSSANNNDYSGRFSTAPGQAYSIDINGQNVTFGTPLASAGAGLTLMDSTSGGSLNVQAGTIGGNVMVVGGTLELNGATALSSGAIVTLPTTPSGAMNLNFSGTMTISALNFGTVSMATGTYGSLTSSAANKNAAFTGNGILNVTGSTANTYYWDTGPIGAYPGSGGTGCWDGSSANWFTGSSDQGWPGNLIASFAGTNGTVTVDGSVTAYGLTFYTAGYILTNTTGNALTMAGPAPAIIVPAGTTTLAGSLVGSGLTFSGYGPILLTGSNALTTATISPNTTVQMNNVNGLGGSAGTVTDNGTLQINVGAGTSSNGIAGNGAVSVIETTGANSSLSGPMSSFTGSLNLPASPGGTAKTQILTPAVAINSAATINVTNGGTFYVAGGAGVVIPCAVNMFGIGNAEAYGALRVESGATVSGPVALSGNTTIGGNSGTGPGNITGAISDGGHGYSVTKTSPAGGIILSGTNTYTGATTISGGVLAIGGSGSLGSGNYSANITNNSIFVYGSSITQTLSGVISGSGQVTNNGPGTLILNNAANSYSGNVTLVGGILDVPNQHSIGDGLNTSYIVFNGGTLENDDTTVGDNFALNYSMLVASGGGVFYTPTAGQSLLVPNQIIGIGGLTKTGSGEIILTDVDTYSGPTIISAGALGLSGSGSIVDSTLISVAGGATFDVTGLPFFTMASSQVLSNSTSTAFINGSVNPGAGTLSLTYAAGTPSFTIANGTMGISSSTTVKVNNTGAALGLGTYTLIGIGASGTVAGHAPSSVTVGGNGLQASLQASLAIGSGNTLNLIVASGISANPTNITFSAAANQLTLSWPMDHTGWTLQAQTNKISVGIITNSADWFNVAGSTTTNKIIIPINLSNGCVFYRLMYQ